MTDSDDYQLADSAPLALIVEDDPHAARVGADMLRMLGYRSRIAVDAHEALYALAEGPPSLVLLDICLPEMDGVGLVRIMRRVEGMRAVPVVAASAVYPADSAVAKILAKQGVTTYLSKPFMLQELRRAVDQARSDAMRVGPAPQPTMTDGAMMAITDQQIEEASRSPAGQDEPPESGSVDPAEPPPVEAPAQPVPQTPPTSRGRAAHSIDSGEFHRPSPWAKSASGPSRIPTSTGPASLVLEVTGTGASLEGPVELLFVRVTRLHATIRTVDRPVAVGETLRVEMTHRIPVDDAMTDVKIRVLLHVTSSDPFERGSAAVTSLSGAQPKDHFDALVAWFSMR